ncbi:guanine nucleotide-binding protein subunit alpha-11-like [Paramacrobiotus metropolitanus]|uniref:guanine nucleotide-binding protein subunit alpha-11-like n=1 Tax=Paramacrobiotus metropolitanus TaxID=2943436 RepID=UPI002445BBF6|nr:guanine nucleotide-binding protein subunit alpha-11-like [Paramacrobiotus metropolitanus]
MGFTFCPCRKCWGSKLDPEAQRIHDAVKKQLTRDREIYRNKMKILLLGAGEAGKSTILKQIQMIHGRQYSDGERRQFVVLIRRNLLDAIQTLIHAMDQLNIQYQDDANASLAQKIRSLSPTDSVFDQDTANKTEQLWRDEGIQQAYDRRREFVLSDSAKFFLDQAAAIGTDDFLPDDHCIMRMRVATTGIVEYPAHYRGMDLLFVDVGGQRTERRKWIHAFDNVSSLFFVASLSDYDQMVVEAAGKNRMEESVNLFDTVLRTPYFRSSTIILFLNKMDLLEEKIPHSRLEEHFPEYKPNLPGSGESDYERARKFIKSLYTDVFAGARLAGRDEDSSLYSHFTCATDRSCVERVYYNIRDDILNRALGDYAVG